MTASRRSLGLSLLLMCLLPIAAHGQREATSSLERNFKTPPATDGPWVYWMWLRVQSSHESITADLEAMRSKGIRGAILYDSGVGGRLEASKHMVLVGKEYRAVPTTDFKDAHFTPIPYPAIATWQPQSLELMRYAASEAARLGLKLVINVGLASTSGDIGPEDGQQRLIWSETTITGGAYVNQLLDRPSHAVKGSSSGVASLVPERSDFGEHPESFHALATFALPSAQNTASAQNIAPADLIDLTSQVSGDGRLQWQAPAGTWRILRFGYEPTRMHNVWGLYTDAMSAHALDDTWDVTMGRLIKEMTPAERKGLYGIEDDSWEAGTSTWTANFAAEFQKRRGYDLRPWLPVLAGLPLGSPNQADGVRRDYYRTIADLIAENHYAHLGAIARKNHLVSFSEAAGPNSGQLDSDQNAAQIDVPMGEFWMPSEHRPTPDRRFLVHDSASAAHIQGKRTVGCESFTSVGPQWEESFFDMKNTADQGFTEGCNFTVIHNFSQSPSLTAKPGYVYFAGTHYGRNVTWWNQTPAFNTYLGRSAYMLQQGHFAADVLYFRGDGIGQLEQRKKDLPAFGYDHDNIDLDALLHRLSFQNGRLTLPDGMTYRILVLPAQGPMSMEALHKIASLVHSGAVVVGPRPTGVAGLVTAQQQQDFDALVATLWSVDPLVGLKQGQIFAGEPIEALNLLHLQPDFGVTGVSTEGEVNWIHRRTHDADIYYVTSRWDAVERVVATFRISGKQPELWDPVTGATRDARAFTQEDGATSVPLTFGPRGSIYVVFRRPISNRVSGHASTNEAVFTPVETVTGPWQVSFDPAWGGPAQVTFGSLEDWAQRPETGIRFYSGTAVYRKTLRLSALPPAGEKLMLDLGEVHEVAEVRLNGKFLGVVWTRPALIEITPAVHVGENTLEIKVVNLWPNRLIGDSSLPLAEQLTQTNIHKFSSATPLYKSGLIGPVKIELSK